MPLVTLCYECLDDAGLDHVYMTRRGKTGSCAVCNKENVLTWEYESERLRFKDEEKQGTVCKGD